MEVVNRVRVQSFTGEMKIIPVWQFMTVQQLKVEIMNAFLMTSYWCVVGVQCKDALRLVFEGKPLESDSAPLETCGLKDMAMVQVVKKVTGG